MGQLCSLTPLRCGDSEVYKTFSKVVLWEMPREDARAKSAPRKGPLVCF